MKYYKSLTSEKKTPIQNMDVSEYVDSHTYLPAILSLRLYSDGYHLTDKNTILPFVNDLLYEVEPIGAMIQKEYLPKGNLYICHTYKFTKKVEEHSWKSIKGMLLYIASTELETGSFEHLAYLFTKHESKEIGFDKYFYVSNPNYRRNTRLNYNFFQSNKGNVFEAVYIMCNICRGYRNYIYTYLNKINMYNDFFDQCKVLYG